MNPSHNTFVSESMYETSIFNSIGPATFIRNSPARKASCQFYLRERAVSNLSNKKSPAIHSSLKPKIMILLAYVVLTLFVGGLQGKAESQENDINDRGLRLVLQHLTNVNDPFSGTWTLNVLKSKISSQLPNLKSQISNVVVDASDIEVTQETILKSGEKLNMNVKAKFDGRDYQVTGSPSAYSDIYSVAYKRVDKNTVKAVLKIDGKVVGHETGILSPDGKTLAVINYTMDATGKQVVLFAVFEKE